MQFSLLVLSLLDSCLHREDITSMDILHCEVTCAFESGEVVTIYCRDDGSCELQYVLDNILICLLQHPCEPGVCRGLPEGSLLRLFQFFLCGGD